MHTIAALILLCKAGFYTCLLGMIVGLYQPWLVLWWLDRQNRKTVLKAYGTGAIAFVLLTSFLAMI